VSVDRVLSSLINLIDYNLQG